MLTDKDLTVFRAIQSPAATYLRVKLLELDRNTRTARFSFDVGHEFENALGDIQGGFVAAMLDEAAGLTVRLVTNGEVGVPSLDFRLTFFSPTKAGTVYAIGRLLRLGRRTAFMEADLFDAESNLLSRMSVTALVVQSGDGGSSSNAPAAG